MKSSTNELEKCKNSPYHFAISYLKVKTPKGEVPFTTLLSEEEFNDEIKQLQTLNFYKKRRR